MDKTYSPDMVANNLTPAFPTHPGEVLKDEIEYRGISQRKLAEEMGIAYSALNEILNAKQKRPPCFLRLLSVLTLNLY